jgi:type VII secretion protein EccB
MASRSDQLHSHQFTLQRAVGALARRDPDPVASPLRRTGGALFAGVMVAVLAVAAVGVYGVLRPGAGDRWRDGQSMIIEAETGARYVFRDGVLYPVLNHTSARLILGGPATVQVPGSALVGVPRGAPLGIAGAPDPLPGPSELVADAWTLCSRPAADVVGESVLRVGAPSSGDALGDRGVLAVDPGGGLHLLWHGRRYALMEPDLVLGAFAWSRASASPVAPALLNAVPAGTDLGRIVLPAPARPSPVDGYAIGDVVRVTNQTGDQTFGVILDSGFADLTPVQAGLLVAAGAPERAMAAPAFVAAPKSPVSLKPTGDGAPPERVPAQYRPPSAGTLCASFASDQPAVLSVAAARPDPFEVRASPQPVGVTAQWIAVPPGRGAVVEALASPGAPSGALAVVTDQGLRFPVPSREVLSSLGFGDVRPLRLPAGLVALVPSGPALDPAAAVQPALVSGSYPQAQKPG